ncbi:MAG TPA: hypothetical protein ENN42_01125 [Thioalkalivibrio sp.]|nr:hypothetical protein [Thioalkalivibrio sp.]
MSSVTGLALARASHGQIDYALARIHHRIARLPSEAAWGVLAPVAGYAHYLDAARPTLEYWLRGLGREADVHALEQALRLRFVEELARLAGWLPPAFAPLLHWCGHLPYLDFISFLHRRESAPAWMHDDPRLAAWLGETDADLGALQRDLDDQSLARDAGRHRVVRNWLDGFRPRLPDGLSPLAEDARFNALLTAVLEGHPVHEAGISAEARVQPRLLREAHRHMMQATLVPVYVLLAYWVLLRLRAELAPRNLGLGVSA